LIAEITAHYVVVVTCWLSVIWSFGKRLLLATGHFDFRDVGCSILDQSSI